VRRTFDAVLHRQ